MSSVFLYCALIGGTFLVCQFVMTLIGLAHGVDGDVAHDAPDAIDGHGGDLYGIDVHAGDVHAGDVHVGDVHVEDAALADVHGGDLTSGDVDGDLQGADDHHGSTSLFGVLSFRALVAAATFFGLAGMTANTAEMSIFNQLLIAVICGGAALFGVHWLMRSLYRLGQSGTLRINRTIGKTARVNVSIPGGNSGQGKVHVKVQGRLTELAAVTSAKERLAMGSEVVVIGVTGGNILEVEPLTRPVETPRRNDLHL